MRGVFWAIFVCFTIACFPLPGLAATVQDVPNPRQVYGGWVTDMADILSFETEAKLDRIISRLERKNGSEIAVVTVPETAPAATPKQFAIELFNYWGVGKKDKNNGVLFLISKGDRRVEIETGYGVTDILPNTWLSEIIDYEIIPRFKEDDFDSGTLISVEDIVLALEKFDTQANRDENLIYVTVVLTIATGLFVGIFIFEVSRPDYVEPEGRSRIYGMIKDPVCANCKQPMEKLDWESFVSYLTEPEQVAQKIGSVRFQGWRCPNCQNNRNIQGVHIRACVLDNKQFKTCSNCKELTVERTSKLLEKATTKKEGKRLIIEKCQCCSYFNATVTIVPQISSSYSNGYSDGGGYSGGGDFGGGCSGGDGGGGSF